MPGKTSRAFFPTKIRVAVRVLGSITVLWVDARLRLDGTGAVAPFALTGTVCPRSTNAAMMKAAQDDETPLDIDIRLSCRRLSRKSDEIE
jgi:hypothetical protein